MLAPNLFGYDLLSLNEISMILRLFLSALLSGVLGFERVRKRRAAGVRTYILVCTGAALVMMTGQFVTQTYGVGHDAMRIGAQVVSGIGFIGAGTILVTGQHRIKGLTTAAGLWSSACIGLAVGAGFYWGGIAVTCIIILTMTIMERVQTAFESRIKTIQLYVLFDNMSRISAFFEFVRDHAMTVSDFETIRVAGDVGIGANFKINLKKQQSHSEVLELLSGFEGITFFEEF